jgi:hypothetical protein
LNAYLDTSALAKWYVPEQGSEAVATFLAEVGDVLISRLAVAEMRCLLARRRRAGMLSTAMEATIYGRFTEQIAQGHLQVEPLADARLVDALDLIRRLPDVPLRTPDAIHLASALAAAVSILATADLVMRSAAIELGIEVAFFGVTPA